MLRLSIIVPLINQVDEFEKTLISVLENRPDECEVVVPTAADYADPYSLDGDEIRLLRLNDVAPIELLQAAAEDASADLCHIVLPGVEVSDGWCTPALRHFTRPEVASVASLIHDKNREGRISSAGLRYGLGGQRSAYKQGARATRTERLRQPTLGADLAASFYRTELLIDLCKCSKSFPLPIVDLDWALLLREAGQLTMLEPNCVVYRDAVDTNWGSVQLARATQQMFARHFRTADWWRLPTFHLLSWLADMTYNPPISFVSALTGRLLGLFGVGELRADRELAVEALQPAADVLAFPDEQSWTASEEHRKAA